MFDMLVSVIIPTFDRAGLLAKCITAFDRQTAPGGSFEVIVVDDGSYDQTPQILADLARTRPWLTPLRQVHRGPAAARNFGLEKASGVITAFTDDDCAVDQGWVAAIREVFWNSYTDPHVVGVGGFMQPRPNGSMVSTYLAFTDPFGEPARGTGGEFAYLNTANAAYLKSALEMVGGFDERFTRPGGEDVDLSVRLRNRGFSFTVCSEMRVEYGYRSTVTAMLRTQWNYGMGQWRVEHAASKEGSLVRNTFSACALRWLARVRRRQFEFRTSGVSQARGLAFQGLAVMSKAAYRAGYQFMHTSERIGRHRTKLADDT